MMAGQRKADAVLFDAATARQDFPVFGQEINNHPLTYLDSAASAQKPHVVTEAMTEMMSSYYANIHRGLYRFSQQTTLAYEQARQKLADFLGAKSAEEIVFTRNATEAINLVAASWGRANLQKGDEIILTELEHHANIVPWHLLSQELGFTIKVLPLLKDPSLGLDTEKFSGLVTDKTKLVAMTHMSNVTGEIPPVQDFIKAAKAVGAKVLLDGSQAAVHMPVDVTALGCDFYVVTGHKLYGPTGIGALWAKAEILADMPPYQGGGEMIENVTFEKITYKKPPMRFEAGTPAFVEAHGLGAALDYLSGFDRDAVLAHEIALADMTAAGLRDLGGVTLYGDKTAEKGGIVSFSLDGIHPHDAATVLDQMGIALRAGKHCADPFMAARGISATLRASFGMYNTEDDVTRFLDGIAKTRKMFG